MVSLKSFIKSAFFAASTFLLASPAVSQVQLGGHIVVPSTSDSPLGASNVVMSDSDCNIVTASGCSISNGPYVKNLNVTGSLGAPRHLIVVLSPGREYTVTNGTTQNLLVGGPSGATVTVAPATTVTVAAADGANYMPMSPALGANITAGTLIGKQTNSHNMVSQFGSVSSACGATGIICNIDPTSNVLDQPFGVFTLNNRYFPIYPFSRILDERWGATSDVSEGPGIKHQINSEHTFSLYKPVPVTLSRVSNVTTLTMTGMTDNRWCYTPLGRIIYGATNSSFNSPQSSSFPYPYVSQILPSTCSNNSFTYYDPGSDATATATLTTTPSSGGNIVFNSVEAGRGWGGVGGEAGGSHVYTNCLILMKGINSCLGGVANESTTGDFQTWGYWYEIYHSQELGNADDEKGYGVAHQSIETPLVPQFHITSIGSQPNYLYLSGYDGQGYAGDGHWLLETKNASGATAAFYPGNITNALPASPSGMAQLNVLTVDATVPVSTSWGTSTTLVVPPNDDMGAAGMTVTLTKVGGAGSPTSGYMCFANAERFERVNVTMSGSVATGTFRESFTYAPVYWFQGGMCNAPAGGAVAAKLSAMMYGKASPKWSSAVTYNSGDTVSYVVAGEYLYFTSLQGGNLNNAPSLSSTWWKTKPVTNQVIKILGSTDAHTIAYTTTRNFRPISLGANNVTPETATGVTLTRNSSGLVIMTGVPTSTGSPTYDPLNWCERAGVVITATDTSFNGTVTTSCRSVAGTSAAAGTYSWQTSNTTPATTTATAVSDIDQEHIAFYPMNEVLSTIDETYTCAKYDCYVEVDPSDLTYVTGMTVEDDIGAAAQYRPDFRINTCYSGGCNGTYEVESGDGIRGRDGYNDVGYVAHEYQLGNLCGMYQGCGGPYVGPTFTAIGGGWSTIFDFRNFDAGGDAIVNGGTIFNLPCPVIATGGGDDCQGLGDQYTIFRMPTRNTGGGLLINNVANDSLDFGFNAIGQEQGYSFGLNSWKLGLSNGATPGTINGVVRFNETPAFWGGINLSYNGDTELLYTNQSFWFFPKHIQVPDGVLVTTTGVNGLNLTANSGGAGIDNNTPANGIATSSAWQFFNYGPVFHAGISLSTGGSETENLTTNGTYWLFPKSAQIPNIVAVTDSSGNQLNLQANSGGTHINNAGGSGLIDSSSPWAFAGLVSLNGTATTPTATFGDNSTKVASTAFVTAAVNAVTAPTIANSANVYTANSQVQVDSVVSSTLYGLYCFGDSYMAGYGAFTTPAGQCNLVASDLNTALIANEAVPGTVAQDLAFEMISDINPSDTGNPIVIASSSINNVGGGSLPDFNRTTYAAYAWGAMSSTQKVPIATNGITATGTTAADTTFANFNGLVCSSGPCTYTYTATVGTSGVFYLWYRMYSTGSFTVKIDGTTATDTVTGNTSINTTWTTGPNYVASTVGLARYTASATSPGTHTIVITAGTNVSILGFGFPGMQRQRGISPPKVYMGGTALKPGNTSSATQVINSASLAIDKVLVADGLFVPFVDLYNAYNYNLDFNYTYFTASQSGTTLTVASSPTPVGTIVLGQPIYVAGVSIGYVTAFGTGTGGAGTYTLNTSATVASTSMIQSTQGCLSSTAYPHPNNCGHRDAANAWESVINAAPSIWGGTAGSLSNPLTAKGPIVVNYPTGGPASVSQFTTFAPQSYSDTLIGGIDVAPLNAGGHYGMKFLFDSTNTVFGLSLYATDSAKQIEMCWANTSNPTADYNFNNCAVRFTSTGIINGGALNITGVTSTGAGVIAATDSAAVTSAAGFSHMTPHSYSDTLIDKWNVCSLDNCGVGMMNNSQGFGVGLYDTNTAKPIYLGCWSTTTSPTSEANFNCPVYLASSGVLYSQGITLNPTATATSVTNYNSSSIVLASSFYNGSATADTWSITNLVGSGSTPPSTLSFTHSGSGGTAKVSFPALQAITLVATGGTTSSAYSTQSNCNSTASPAVCGAATAGTVQVPASATTLTVDTTGLDAASEIFYQYTTAASGCTVPANMGSLLPAYTSNINYLSGSFQMTLPVAPTTTPVCVSFHIMN